MHFKKCASLLVLAIFIAFAFLSPTPVFAADVVINEVYYDVDSSHGSETSPVNEWIELYNKTGSSIDISGWTVTDNSSTKTIPSGISIASNGLMLLSPDSTTWTYWNIDGTVVEVVMNIGNGLSNTGDKLILKDGSGNEIDKLSYGANIDIWNPSIPDVDEGHSLERVPGGQDNDAIADFIDQESPTPGRLIAQAPTSTPTPLPTNTPTPTNAPTATNTPSPSPTPKPTVTPSPVPSITPTPKLVGRSEVLSASESSNISLGETQAQSLQITVAPETSESAVVLGEKKNLAFIGGGILVIASGIMLGWKYILPKVLQKQQN